MANLSPVTGQAFCRSRVRQQEDVELALDAAARGETSVG